MQSPFLPECNVEGIDLEQASNFYSDFANPYCYSCGDSFCYCSYSDVYVGKEISAPS